MKTIATILSASTLALLAIAAFAGSAKLGHLKPGQLKPGHARTVEVGDRGWSSATWRQPIAGSRAILAARFEPLTSAVVAPILETALPQDDALRGGEADEAEAGALPAMTVHWSLPLISRFITGSRRLESMSPDLQEAINRIEPMYDQTRPDGLYTDSILLRIWAGTASMSDVFGEHWHLASDDPNVNAKVETIGTAWLRAGPAPCEAFTKNRQHDFGEPTLTGLDAWDCLRLQKRQAPHFNDADPVAIVVAALSVPVFAAPMPGSRLSSEDFWAAQRARINAIQARIRRKWQAATPAQAMASPSVKMPPIKVSSNR